MNRELERWSRNRLMAAGLAVALTAAAAGALIGTGAEAATPTVAGHSYLLTVVSSGQKADVEGASLTAGAPVLHWNTNSAPNQQWRAADAGGGAITLAAVHSGQCMDVKGRFLAPGVVVQQWPCNGGTNQRWLLTASGTTGGYAVKSVNSGLCLDASHGPAVKVAQLTQWTCDGGTAQQWRFTEKGSTGVGSKVGVWGPSVTAGGRTFMNETVRMIAHATAGGANVQIKLSNYRSTTPVTIGAVDVALRSTGANAVAGSHHVVTFGRAGSVTIAAGAEVTSDVIGVSVAADQSLLVSLYLPQATGASTQHANGHDTMYVAAGDHVADDTTANYATVIHSFYYLSEVDVVAPTATGTVVAFGDSITDGSSSRDGLNQRWPDYLGRRLAAEAGGQRLGVVDAGIGGNRVLSNAQTGQGIAGVNRFAHDALGVAQVKDVIVLEGVNDLNSNASLTVAQLEAGYQNLITQAHAAGVRIIGATILPNNTMSASANSTRQQVNRWILTSGAFDAAVDTDAALRDPANPLHLNPLYNGGDGLHPNSAGMSAIADTINLSLLHS